MKFGLKMKSTDILVNIKISLTKQTAYILYFYTSVALFVQDWITDLGYYLHIHIQNPVPGSTHKQKYYSRFQFFTVVLLQYILIMAMVVGRPLSIPVFTVCCFGFYVIDININVWSSNIINYVI